MSEDDKIQQMVEESRADSKAHGARLVEKYGAQEIVTDQDSPADITMKKATTLMSAVTGLEDAGYVATEVGEVEVLKTLFPTKHEMEDGTTVTVVATVRATIRGYKP